MFSVPGGNLPLSHAPKHWQNSGTLSFPHPCLAPPDPNMCSFDSFCILQSHIVYYGLSHCSPTGAPWDKQIASNLKMEMLCLPIAFQKISPRWLMTVASLIVWRKNEWDRISKESSHLQSRSCTVLSCSSRLSKAAHGHPGRAGSRKEVRLEAGGEGRCRAGGGKHWPWSHVIHSPGHWMT